MKRAMDILIEKNSLRSLFKMQRIDYGLKVAYLVT